MKNRRNEDPQTKLGCYLCLILRNQPEVIGITLDLER